MKFIPVSARRPASARDVLLYRLGLDPFRGARVGGESRGRFYCGPEDTPRVIEVLRRRMPEQVEAIWPEPGAASTAASTCSGTTASISGATSIGVSIPSTENGRRSSPGRKFDFLNFAEMGDHKVIWELNRLQFLVTLAKAYRVTGDERFAAGLKDLWYDWRRKNPYPMGVNWASTLEVAFRALSLLWAAFLLEGTPADSETFQRDTTREIALSAWYISRFLSTWFSPNTHLLGEGAALLLIGLRYPGLARAGQWRTTGWRIVGQEASRQVRADGLHFEQSIYYHVYALDFFLHARLMAARNGLAIPRELDDTIRAMMSALAQLSQAGALPRFGDDDGGRLFDPSRNRPEHLLDPLSTGAALFHDGGFKAAVPGLCEETLWLLGPGAAAAFDDVPRTAPPPRSVAFAASGIYAMTLPGPPVSQLFIDGGELGALSAGHGHADALSVQLARQGRLWLTDPGTCAYADGSARERFRGTSAHNTMAIDGRPQADPKGPFSWGRLPRAQTLRWVAGETFDLFEGCHSGYERLADPVTHRRWVVRWGAGLWLVRDVAEGRGAHRFDVYWHFAPEVSVATEGPALVSRLEGESLVVLPARLPGWECAVEMGEYSPAYGLTVPAPVARWSTSAACPAEFAAVIGFGRGIAEARLDLADPGANGVVAYQYAAGGERRWFFFATREGAWMSGNWASDAAVLCFGADELFFAGGSYVEYAGKRAVECRATIAAPGVPKGRRSLGRHRPGSGAAESGVPSRAIVMKLFWRGPEGDLRVGGIPFSFRDIHAFCVLVRREVGRPVGRSERRYAHRARRRRPGRRIPGRRHPPALPVRRPRVPGRRLP